MFQKLNKTIVIASAAVCLSHCGNQSSQSISAPFQQGVVKKITTYDTPGRCSEIISYAPSKKLLFTTNSVSKDISVLAIPSLAAGNFRPIDFDLQKSGVQGISTGGEPTSVAVHPNRNLVLAAVNGGNGRLVAFDMTAAAKGVSKKVLDQEIGFHLDSIAISPNGKWAVIADEAEGSANTPGAIILVDISRIGSSQKLPVYKVSNLASSLGRPAGRVEPEFVAIDSSSRYAAVACQDDNAVVLFPLTANPKVSSVIKLPNSAQPDGANLINYGSGQLLAIAEEGTDTVALFQVNSINQTPKLITRINVRTLSGKGDRCDPEGVYMFRQSGKLYLAVAIERANRALIMDISNPRSPKKVASVPVGSRPEGLIVQKQGGKSYVLTGDEGKPGKGEVSIIEVR